MSSNKPRVVILVYGGVVQAVYSSSLNTRIEVIDLDISSFPDEEELQELTSKREEFDRIKSTLYQVY